MVEPLMPTRGGFIKPFGCGWFIKEFLLGHGPEGSPTMNPVKGACQQDIFFHYKIALHRAYAQKAADYENEQRVSQGKPIYTETEYAKRVEYFMSRMPYKLVKCRYHSFSRYFHFLKQLGWVKFTGATEPSEIQEAMALGAGEKPRATGQPRIYYRLTPGGRAASLAEVSNPLRLLYPHFTSEYFRRAKKAKRYFRR